MTSNDGCKLAISLPRNQLRLALLRIPDGTILAYPIPARIGGEANRKEKNQNPKTRPDRNTDPKGNVQASGCRPTAW